VSRVLGRRPPGANGFTLIELVLVLGVIAISTLLVLPAVGRGIAQVQLRSQAGHVAAVLRQARQQAVSLRHTTRVTLDRARNTVALSTGRSDATPREVSLPAGLRLSVGKGGEVVPFSPRGLSRDTRWVLEAAGGRRLAITVDAITGRVTVGAEPPS